MTFSSERSSGGRERRGRITKAGNVRVRLLLVEAAWHYRHRPAVSFRLRERRRGQPARGIAIADRAPHLQAVERGAVMRVIEKVFQREQEMLAVGLANLAMGRMIWAKLSTCRPLRVAPKPSGSAASSRSWAYCGMRLPP